MRRSAFTLMELLIVIAIIMILMGLIFAGVAIAKRSALKFKTRGSLAALSSALASYHTGSGVFPSQDPTPLPASWTGSFSGYVISNKFSDYSPSDWDSFNRALCSALNDSGEAFKAPMLDAWKQPFHYRPARFYPYLPSGAAIDKDDPPARDSYQLWSTGEDTHDQGGESGSDDMTSWSQ